MESLNSLESIDDFIKNNFISIVYFGDKNCGVCRELLPKIRNIVHEYEDMKFAYAEIEQVKSAMGKYSVFTFPAIIVYIEGKEVLREARFINTEEFNYNLKRYYDMAKYKE